MKSETKEVMNINWGRDSEVYSFFEAILESIHKIAESDY